MISKKDKGIITAMMLLEMAMERQSNQCYEQFTEQDYILTAHSILQVERGGKHSYAKASDIIAKIEADSAIENAMQQAWIEPKLGKP